MSDEGRGIEEIAADLQSTRGSLREARAEADKVPGLQREIDRLSGLLEKGEARSKDLQDREADLEQHAAELEARLRGEDELVAEKSAAEDALADSREERAEALEHADHLEQENARLSGELEGASAEIDRLKVHEEHTREFQALLDKTKGL